MLFKWRIDTWINPSPEPTPKYCLTPCQLLTQYNFPQRHYFTHMNHYWWDMLVAKTEKKKNPWVVSKRVMLLLDVGRHGIVFQNLNLKQSSTISTHIQSFKAFWEEKATFLYEGYFFLVQTIRSLAATFSVRDRSMKAIWSRASLTDALFFKSIPLHPRKSRFERRLILLSICVGNDPINSVLIHFQLSGY